MTPADNNGSGARELRAWAITAAGLPDWERRTRIVVQASEMGGTDEDIATCEAAVVQAEQDAAAEDARAAHRRAAGGNGSKPSSALGDAATVPPAARLKLIPMADVIASPVEWLWAGRLPRGKLSVLAGDPGLGKSYLTLKIAAIISQGGEWPDGSRATAGNVLIISAEDDYADTIRPRLDRLGADVTRITGIDGVLGDGPEISRPFSLRMDVNLLRQGIADTGAVIVIVDPLNAFLGGIDSHKAAEVRGVLSPLAHVAGETHAAILAVHHLNKGTSANALYRASGSLDFVAAARVVHGVAADPELEGRRVFVPVKCNIAAMPEGIGFRIGEDGINFDRLPVTLDASAAFTSRTIDHEERSEREMAKDFIVEQLADAPVLYKELIKAAKEYGFSEKTIRRAGSDLHVEHTKTGFQGAWQWSLAAGVAAPRVAKECKGAHVSDVGTSDTFEPEGVAPVATFGDPRQPDKALAVVRQAAEIVVGAGAASADLLVTRLGRYEAEAESLLDMLERAQVVGPLTAGARPVLAESVDLEQLMAAYEGTCT